MTEANAEIINLLTICSGQLRVSFGGIVGYDYPALRNVAQDMGICTDRLFWAKIRACERAMKKAIERSTAVCDSKQQAKCRAQHGSHLAWACEHCEKKHA